MRRSVGAALVSALTLSTAASFGLGSAPAGAQSQTKTATEYVVVYRAGASAAAARAAIKAAGGSIVSERSEIGVAFVKSRRTAFMQVASRAGSVQGVARDRIIGKAPADAATSPAAIRDRVEKEGEGTAAAGARTAAPAGSLSDPLSPLQWDMKMIGATADGSYAKQLGSKKVLVGIIDTGVDGNHPDIKPNFDAGLSRNFTTHDPLIDGPCGPATAHPSCGVDPADVDHDGHGTHVASTIGSPLNGLGMAGVAPNVTLVNVRAGQDSGYFFLKPTIEALMYAADAGIDVVNMSFYTDPWLYNCGPANPAKWRSNPADPNSPLVAIDSPAEQAEQQTIIDATNLALNYAHDKRVTLVSASGNEHTDLGADPKLDQTSPDYPPDTARDRIVSNSCLSMPTEGDFVLSVNSVGPSGRKADYSNYGIEQTSVAAPGGWYRDGLGTPSYKTKNNLILAAYPEAVGRATGKILPDGSIAKGAFVEKDCAGGVCGYYQWIQGTSMASPHATGVVALIVSQYGVPDRMHLEGLTMKPSRVERTLYDSATERDCPEGGIQSYTDIGRPADYTAKCVEAGNDFNGFYGHGIVNAAQAVSEGRD